MSNRNSLMQKALKSPIYIEGNGVRTKHYFIPNKKRKTETIGAVSGSISEYMSDNNIGLIDVQGENRPLDYAVFGSYSPRVTRNKHNRIKGNRRLTRGVKRTRSIPSESKGYNTSGILPKKVLMHILKQRRLKEEQNNKHGIPKTRFIPTPSKKFRTIKPNTVGKREVMNYLSSLGIQSNYSGKNSILYIYPKTKTEIAYVERYKDSSFNFSTMIMIDGKGSARLN